VVVEADIMVDTITHTHTHTHTHTQIHARVEEERIHSHNTRAYQVIDFFDSWFVNAQTLGCNSFKGCVVQHHLYKSAYMIGLI
jgi:hypothetical protein